MSKSDLMRCSVEFIERIKQLQEELQKEALLKNKKLNPEINAVSTTDITLALSKMPVINVASLLTWGDFYEKIDPNWRVKKYRLPKSSLEY